MKKIYLAGISLLAVVFLAALASSEMPSYGMMDSSGQFYSMGYGTDGMMGMMQMMTGYSGYGWGIMALGWITYLLVIALIIAAVYWLIKTANRKR